MYFRLICISRLESMGLEDTPKEDNLERKEGKLRENLRELTQLGWRKVSR